MAYSSSLSLKLFFHYVALIQSISCFASVSSVGFTIPLIPRFSPESPFYRGNLTAHEKIHELVRLSKSRAKHYLQPKPNQTSPDNIRLPVDIDFQSRLYVTKLVLGTPPQTQVLLFDTGSGIIWTQCKPCISCFDQTTPIFDPSQSSSYQTWPHVTPFCTPPYTIVGEECRYDLLYNDGGSSGGIVSREKFTFDRVEGGHVEFNDMVFGCADDNHNIYFQGREVSGMVGLSTFRHSFLQQFSSMIQGRFSYCLSMELESSGVVKFGEDAVIPVGPDVVSIPFVKQNIQEHYYLNLVDISVGDYRIGFTPGTFELQSDGSQGCIIDSGSATTYIDHSPYVAVTSVFNEYFKAKGLERFTLPGLELEYCYKFNPEFKEYIGMTFHFAEGDYVIGSNMYYLNEERGYICLVLLPGQHKTIIGAWQQQNMMFVYDVNQQMLHYKPEDCKNF